MLPRALALLLCSAMLALPCAPAQAHHADRADRTDPTVTPRAARAVAALERVESATGDRTIALRDLALTRADLPPALQQRAASYLSRPTANPDRCPDYSCYRTKRVLRACSAVVCVHYVRHADDARNGVPAGDADHDGRPNYVERVLESVTGVHRTYVAAGYRPPVGDGQRGGDARPDVYLSQIGDQGLYGYCTTDAASPPQHGATWAYCVLDNDYAANEFPAHTPIQNMQVTAAHEYFHAVQFGYDIGEDAWFMEATATWAEDEVYDRVDDNVAYLPIGPMGHPAWSLDSTREGYYYGAWIFFRSVTERFRHAEAGMPLIVREMWRYADAATPQAPDLYSMEAVDRALGDKDSSTAAQLLRMAAANLHPRRWYVEGGRYPTTPLAGTRTLTAAQPGAQIDFTQDHLTSASYRFEPAAGLTEDDWRLQITLDLAPALQASQALVRVILHDGGVRTAVLTLLPTGDFTGSFAFSAATVKAVELTVVNGSTRYRCNVSTGWSCHGRPLDQDVAQSVAVVAARLSG